MNKTWYHCIDYFSNPEKPKAFGFSVTENGYIFDHPDYRWHGIHVSSYKLVLLNKKIKVYKVN